MNKLIYDKTFSKETSIPKGEYDNCVFSNSTLSKIDLSRAQFISCEFNNCDLSNVVINNASFKEVTFNDCKLFGVNFEHTNPFLFACHFNNSSLNLASFYNTNLKNSSFNNCQLQEVDFAEADLSQLILNNCDCNAAIFERTLLVETDFSSSFNYSINPSENNINNAKFSQEGITGLLAHLNIIIE